MKRRYLAGLFLLIAVAVGPATAFAQVEQISAFREYSPLFASSGQPTEAQLGEVSAAGFERVIYIAFSNSGNAIPSEDQIVRELGMDYVHIPVVWTSPTLDDFNAFAAVMQQSPDKKTLLHCQVNYRASAFSFLYRVIHEGVSVAEAKADLDTVWAPDATWRAFIFDVLAAHQISPDCAGCSWALPE